VVQRLVRDLAAPEAESWRPRAGTPHPDAAKMAAMATKASRFNTYASGPILFGMIVPNNYAGWPAVGMLLAIVLGRRLLVRDDQALVKIKTTV